MKQFGFPQIARGGDGGDGGGGDSDGEWEDALAEATNDFEAIDHTDFSSSSVGRGGLADANFSAMAPDMSFDEFGFSNVDWDAYGPADTFADRGFSQSFAPGTAQESDPFGFGATGTFGYGPSFADVWGAQGLGYNTNPGSMTPQDSAPFGFGAQGEFGLDQPTASITVNARGAAQESDPFGFGPRGDFGLPGITPGWESPFGIASPGIGSGPGSIFDGRFTGLPDPGLTAFSPAPEIAANPSNPGYFSPSNPGATIPMSASPAQGYAPSAQSIGPTGAFDPSGGGLYENQLMNPDVQGMIRAQSGAAGGGGDVFSQRYGWLTPAQAEHYMNQGANYSGWSGRPIIDHALSFQNQHGFMPVSWDDNFDARGGWATFQGGAPAA